jgi:hypothetical protein
MDCKQANGKLPRKAVRAQSASAALRDFGCVAQPSELKKP